MEVVKKWCGPYPLLGRSQVIVTILKLIATDEELNQLRLTGKRRHFFSCWQPGVKNVTVHVWWLFQWLSVAIRNDSELPQSLPWELKGIPYKIGELCCAFITMETTLAKREFSLINEKVLLSNATQRGHCTASLSASGNRLTED